VAEYFFELTQDDQHAALVAHRETLGRTINTMDAFIAATAQVRKLTLATPNQDDFAASVDAIVNPWSGIERR
jgi:predicted nucleic acid-binding protein